MSVFVDTSAVLAFLDAGDPFHARAREAWDRLLQEDEQLVTSSYALVETYALVQSRLGMGAVQTVAEDIAPLLRVRWLDEGVHAVALASMLAAARRKLSLVDCASFAVMHELGLRRAFAFGKQFTERGFELVA